LGARSPTEVEVRVPATVANLGPGFDCLGVALGVHLRLRVSPAASEEAPPPNRNLTHRSFAEAFGATGRRAPPVSVQVLESYPSARGMGASASAIVAGLVAARLMGELEMSDQELARLAIEIEGHPDNVVPALLGGLVLCSGQTWMRLEPHPGVSPLVLVARERFKTVEARRALPAEVPRADAVANAAALSALVMALTGLEPPTALMLATEDRIHEPYRLALMHETADLHAVLRAKGVPTALAGAGPSLICLVETRSLEGCTRLARERLPEGWQAISPGWDLLGAQARPLTSADVGLEH
ncbi:MAG: homoserine kinase, partial [Actinomycetota bacterium]